VSLFLFDGRNSSTYNLAIGHIGRRGPTPVNTFANTEIISDRAGNRLSPYIFGARTSPEISFPLEIYRTIPGGFTLEEASNIQGWLFGRKQPHNLTIINTQRGTRTYRCFLTNPQIVILDGNVVGWQFTVECIQPYTTGEVRTIPLYYALTEPSSTVIIDNDSNIDDFIYPTIVLRYSTLRRTHVRINGLEVYCNFQDPLTGVNEVIINNNLRDVRTSVSQSIFNGLSLINFRWLRLVKGRNEIRVLVLDTTNLISIELMFIPKYAICGF